MHWPASRPFRVLYVDGEMSRRVMKERLADAVKRLGQKPAGMHLLCHEDVPDGGWHPLNTPEGQTLIEKIIVSIGGIDLIIFDNIMALIEGDQKDEERLAEDYAVDTKADAAADCPDLDTPHWS